MIESEDRLTQNPHNNFRQRLIIAITIIVVGILFYGAYRVYRWDANRKALAEKDRIARMQQSPQINITLIEGWSDGEIYRYLESKRLGSVAAYEAAEKEIDRSKFDFLADLKKSDSLEGFLFPDTYRVYQDATPKDILEKLLNTFEQKWETIAESSAQKSVSRLQIPGYENLKLNKDFSGLTLPELVTLASIVEKETGRPGENAGSDRLQEERQYVAGIFYNRLLIGQALESDATINYITRGGRAAPTSKDLEAVSPYNTYKNPGLPPGPIANPSFASLYAVLRPIKSDYYYFLHKQPSGEIVYSKTYQGHLENKRKFLK